MKGLFYMYKIFTAISFLTDLSYSTWQKANDSKKQNQ
jgi:hypothetical protein